MTDPRSAPRTPTIAGRPAVLVVTRGARSGSAQASWDVQHPLGKRRVAPAKRAPYAFLPTEGENLHQIPVGPVHAGIIEPGHFRFTANGETVVRLEERLG